MKKTKRFLSILLTLLLIASTLAVCSVPASAVKYYNVNVSADPAEYGSVSGGGSYQEGTTITVTATPYSGYVFKGWYSGATRRSTSTSFTFTVTQNEWLKAEFGKQNCTVTLSAVESSWGTVTGAGTYANGTRVTVTATPNPGYLFERWEYYNETSGKWSLQNTVASFSWAIEWDVVFRAVFKKDTNSYSVAVNAETGGTVSGGGTFESGKSVTVTATPNSGYSFAGWYDGGAKVSEQASYTFAVTKNVTLTAKFEKGVPAAQSAIAIKNFTAEKKVDYRTTITFTAEVTNPVEGADVHWIIDGKDTGVKGAQYTQKEAKKDFTVQAKYVKGDAELAATETETVKVNSGFFAKLIAFFRGLFKKLPVISQAYLGAQIRDN